MLSKLTETIFPKFKGHIWKFCASETFLQVSESYIFPKFVIVPFQMFSEAKKEISGIVGNWKFPKDLINVSAT